MILLHQWERDGASHPELEQKNIHSLWDVQYTGAVHPNPDQHLTYRHQHHHALPEQLPQASPYACLWVFLLPTSRSASLETNASDEPRNAIEHRFVMDECSARPSPPDGWTPRCVVQVGGLHIDGGKWNNAEGGHARFQTCTLDQAVSLHTSTGHRRTSVTVTCCAWSSLRSIQMRRTRSSRCPSYDLAKVASGSEDEEVTGGRTGRGNQGGLSDQPSFHSAPWHLKT